MEETVSHRALAAEMLLVFQVVLHEGDRSEEFAAVCDRVLAGISDDPAEWQAVKRALAGYEGSIGPQASIRALRALPANARRLVAEQTMAFAADDRLFARHLPRLKVRVFDILDVDAGGLPPGERG